MVGSSLRYLASAARTAVALRRFLREEPIGSNAESEVRRHVARREQAFLEVIERAVFGRPESPYLALFRHAGCTLDDVRGLVRTQGLDPALRRLCDAGVYVTHDEMKGRAPVRRGSLVLHVTASDFDNPFLVPHLRGSSTGSTGRGTPAVLNFGLCAERAWQHAVWLEALGLRRAEHAIWMSPTFTGVTRLLRLTRMGSPPRRWFSQVPLNPLKAPRLTRAQFLGLVALGRALGAPFPFPRHVSPDRPGPMIAWAAGALRQGRSVCVDTYTSSAVRACQWAARRGISLRGVTFIVVGESVTAARRAAIEATGARCYPLYGIVEHGMLGAGCLTPAAADDMHVLADLNALIGRPISLPGGRQLTALLATNLSLTLPKVAVNAETGDVGVLEERACGCPLDRLGLRTHVRDVWSVSKLTAEGLTFEGTHVFAILDELLPARFGGGPGDYQLVAEESGGGVTEYVLAVSPAVPRADLAQVRAAFLQALAGCNGATQLAAEFLDRIGQLRAVRRPPLTLPGGKSLPVMLAGSRCALDSSPPKTAIRGNAQR